MRVVPRHLEAGPILALHVESIAGNSTFARRPRRRTLTGDSDRTKSSSVRWKILIIKCRKGFMFLTSAVNLSDIKKENHPITALKWRRCPRFGAPENSRISGPPWGKSAVLPDCDRECQSRTLLIEKRPSSVEKGSPSQKSPDPAIQPIQPRSTPGC
jgi:hypothetical protein